MKKIIALIAAVAFLAGSAYAGCGKKVTDEGTLKSYNAESKEIVVDLGDGKEAKLTLTADTKYKGADGKEAKVADLVDSKVKVTSEHKKVDSVEAAKKAAKKAA